MGGLHRPRQPGLAAERGADVIECETCLSAARAVAAWRTSSRRRAWASTTCCSGARRKDSGRCCRCASFCWASVSNLDRFSGALFAAECAATRADAVWRRQRRCAPGRFARLYLVPTTSALSPSTVPLLLLIRFGQLRAATGQRQPRRQLQRPPGALFARHTLRNRQRARQL